MRLSVLDQSPVPEGSTGPDALRNTLDLARLADELGYHRYWLAEHHGLSLAGPSPEVLIGPVAAATERIRVGSGGVMLPHYSPFKVAENFSLLAGLYPGRIDLGLGRASGTDPLTTYALQRDRRAGARRTTSRSSSPSCSRTSTGSAAGRPPVPPARRHAARRRRERPDVWLLGSSAQSAIWAAQLGAAVRVRGLHQPERRGHRRRLPRAGPRARRAPRSPCGRSARRPTRRPSASPPRSPCRWRCCARTARSRCRRRRRRCATSPSTRRRPGGGADRRLARDGAHRDRGGRRGLRRRRGDRRDDHPRPRRPPALLRADRGGLRACPRSGRSATSACCRLSSSPSSRRPGSSG